jgi:hypothetical protein
MGNETAALVAQKNVGAREINTAGLVILTFHRTFSTKAKDINTV